MPARPRAGSCSEPYRAFSGASSAGGSAFAGVVCAAPAFSSGADAPASAGAVAAGVAAVGRAGAAPVSRSIAERTESRELRLRTASRIGAAAPER